jgi:hypothetical protein
MIEAPFSSIPQGWEVASEAVKSHALHKVQQSLEDPGAAKDLATYYDRKGNYAGATFIELDPVSPWDLTPADLLALTLLSVQAPPYSVRRLLEPSADRNYVLRLLAENRLPLDADLGVADDGRLLAMAELHEALKSLLSPSYVTVKNPWVTASKLCARKRPDLFPVRDSVVCTMLGLGLNYQVDWQVFRSIIQDQDVRSALDTVIDAATERGGNLGHPNRRLRHLDALLWMGASRRGGRASH